MARLDLPRDKKDLVDALNAELIPAENEANVHLTTHRLIDAYLAGVRRFKILDRWTGNLQIAMENVKGELDMRYEEIVRIYLAEVGRYMRMDITPVATKKGESLGALRKAAVANAALGSLSARMPTKKILRRSLIPFLKYGIVGLNHVETGRRASPDMFEIVSPRQLRGLPAWVDGTENLYGIGRKRWVPLAWARKRVHDVFDKKRLPTQNIDEVLQARSVPWGTSPPDQSGQNAHLGQGAATASSFPATRPDVLGVDIGKTRGADGEGGVPKREGRMYVPLEEIYAYDDTQEFCSRFIVKIGNFLVNDADFEKQGIEVLCPLHIARHTDTGQMFSRGFIAPLLPINDQIEKMLASLFKNVQELDMFGTLFVSGSMGIDLKRWRSGPRPKIQVYEPDPLNPEGQPLQMGPNNTGLLPARIVEFTAPLMEKLSGQGPIFQGQASGRVDSAAGLGFLFNTGNIALGLPVNGLADAFAGVYRRMLQTAQQRLGPGETIEIATIDDAIAGVVIDPQTGLLRLSENPIPDAWEVNVDIKDRTPKDREIRKQELKELFGLQLVDDTRFWVTALEENLDMPGAPKELWETWRKVTWQIIMLFRDGKTPGNVDIGLHAQNPDIQLIALQQFMNKIEFSLASPEVRGEFEDWKVDLEIMAGVRFPDGLPPPEELAVQEQAGAQRRPGIQGAGVPPGLAPAGPTA